MNFISSDLYEYLTKDLTKCIICDSNPITHILFPTNLNFFCKDCIMMIAHRSNMISWSCSCSQEVYCPKYQCCFCGAEYCFTDRSNHFRTHILNSKLLTKYQNDICSVISSYINPDVARYVLLPYIQLT